MTTATALPALQPTSNDKARTQFILRFSFSTTACFILCEFMDWQPSAIAAVLTSVLVANLPASPPLKVGATLMIVMAVSAWSAFLFSTLLARVPHLLFGVIGLVMFAAFAVLAQGKARLPLTLLLVCFAVTPVMTLTLSEFAGILPAVLARALMLALLFTWIGFAIWPLPFVKENPAASSPIQSPLAAALIGVVIVLPIMLVYLLFGLIDAIPVLLTTVMLVAQMEVDRGAANARGQLISNFMGGFVAIGAFYLLGIAPSLITLSLIIFLVGIGFAQQIAKGGARGANAILGYNATIIIFGLALLKGPANSGTWSSRVFQFAIACTFAVGMMRLLWPLMKRRPSNPAC